MDKTVLALGMADTLVPDPEIVHTAWVRWGDRIVSGGALILNPLVKTSPERIIACLHVRSAA